MTTRNIILLGLNEFDSSQRVTLHMRNGDRHTGYIHDTTTDDSVLLFKRELDKAWMRIVGAQVCAIDWASGDAA